MLWYRIIITKTWSVLPTRIVIIMAQRAAMTTPLKAIIMTVKTVQIIAF